MTITVALNHRTQYEYQRPVSLSPQLIRLRPAPHCRTPILSYSLQVEPQDHFENVQQDPHGNFLTRCVFPEKTAQFRIEVDLIAEMVVINPFEFFVEPSAEQFPFAYETWLAKELQPFLPRETAGPKLAEWLASVDVAPRNTVDFLVDLNSRLQAEINYLIRWEPGVQTCEETLTLGSGSCRDTAWLLVQILRHLGLAARFVSGYLIQLAADVKSLDGPSGADEDFTDLHAWVEVYLPGAGWVGMDPTSGLLAGEGHIPLAGTPDPSGAAPITGEVEDCPAEFGFSMTVTRLHEDPRVTRPYSDEQWSQIEALGRQVDRRLRERDVRLTMGGEPTFVSVNDMDGEEWCTSAVGPTKRTCAATLLKRLADKYATGGLRHFGEGKWYPGESLPRWAFSCYWRLDGQPLWLDQRWVAEEGRDYGHGAQDARRFVTRLAEVLDVDDGCAIAAYEDVWHYVFQERGLPVNVDPNDSKLKDPEERARLARVVEKGLGQPVGYVLPLRRQWWQAEPRWNSGPWPLRSDALFLLPGDSPMGLRLPLDSLPWTPSHGSEMQPLDPTLPRGRLPEHPGTRLPAGISVRGQFSDTRLQRISRQRRRGVEVEDGRREAAGPVRAAAATSGAEVIRTAVCVEPREGRMHVFMPPVERLEDYLNLVAAVEDAASSLEMPVMLEGYLPPSDHRINHIKVTPDPGVIEVNIHPAHSWDELVRNTTELYEEARQARLGTEKFDLDGRHTGTGGGNHVVLGGPTPLDSPFLRRPDLLRSLIAYWNNHPSLSYLFSGSFIGPTSQAPRVDEGRRDALYELEIAFDQVPEPGTRCPPWLVDRLFRHLLVDVSGNTHRAEFCIDKLYSPDASSGRLGLVEFRAFEMPPHARMSLAQQLLLRALLARFWDEPYRAKLVHWGTTLHDRFLLPHFVQQDFADVIEETGQAGIPLQCAWFAPHFEFRFPRIGSVTQRGIGVELRQAIEPWYVLGEEPSTGGTTRYVDSSVERLQAKVTGMTDSRHTITVNGRRLPLRTSGAEGEFVAGVRYRAWQPPSCLHPTIPVHTPLVFDILDTWLGRSIGGCTYHVANPSGRNPTTFPVNAFEAESRRAARFFNTGHTGGPMTIATDESNCEFPLTLDLRRGPR